MQGIYIHRCTPFQVWVGDDGSVHLAVNGRDSVPMSADVAAVMGSKLVRASAYVATETAKALTSAGKEIKEAEQDMKESAEVASRFKDIGQ